MTTHRHSIGGPDTGHTLHIGGVDVAYHDWGQGPPVVCMHAIGHGAGDFVPLREQVGDRYRLLALDWPDQGRSGPDAQPVSLDRYVELLRGFILALDLEQPVLLGNSIGGAVAVRYAATYPDDVRALVLADPGSLNSRNAFATGFCRAMAWFFRAGVRGAAWYPPVFRLYYRMILREAPARPQRDRIIAAARELAPRLAEAWAHFAEPGSDVRPDAATLRCPVLFTWCRQDRIVQFGMSKRAVSSIPDHRVEWFRGGHAAFLEDPERFAAAFTRFLDSLAPVVSPVG